MTSIIENLVLDKKLNQQKHGVRKSYSQRIKEEEFTVCGWNACLRVFERRPRDIRRVFFSKERARELRDVKKWCQSRRLPYRQLDSESLNKVAASVHHEGVAMVVRPLPVTPAHRLVKQGLSQTGILVALDRVSNSHNVGAILRSCAYFGVEGFLTARERQGPAIASSSMARTAEGALEIVPIFDCSDLPSALRDLKARHVFVLGADPGSDRSLYDTEVTFPCVVVLGNERDGLSPEVKRRCDALARIPGDEAMPSLNVSVAAGVILAELARRKLKNG